RVDSLRNLIADPRIALLFLIPGVGETLRVNGRAEISIDPALLARFPMQGKLPRSVIVVHVEAVYFQCQKALVRSELWNPAKHIERKALPSTGTILADIRRGGRGAVRPRISGADEGDDILTARSRGPKSPAPPVIARSAATKQSPAVG